MFDLILSQIARVVGYIFLGLFIMVIQSESLFKVDMYQQYILIITPLGFAIFMFCMEKVAYEERLKQQMEE